jgi:hypothetical protein
MVHPVCVSLGPAEFSGTILYCGRRLHPGHGLIEVLGYQNTAVNLAAGPNAMLLHLPAASLTPGQFLPAGRAGSVLRDMVRAVRPAAAGPALMGTDWMGGAGGAAVFQRDIYTIVLADSATQIPSALDRVEPRKRPPLNRDLFGFYADLFPGYPVALCCFDNADAAEAKPLMLWYQPADHDRLVLPAIDSHTGTVPDLDADVMTDHWLLLGSDNAGDNWGEPVPYDKQLRRRLLDFLPPRVMGVQVSGLLPNGDFAITHDDLVNGRLDRIERLAPA